MASLTNNPNIYPQYSPLFPLIAEPPPTYRETYIDRNLSAGSITNIAFKRQHGILQRPFEASVLESKLGKFKYVFNTRPNSRLYAESIMTLDDSDYIACFWNERREDLPNQYQIQNQHVDFLKGRTTKYRIKRGNEFARLALDISLAQATFEDEKMYAKCIFQDPNELPSMMIGYGLPNTCAHIYTANGYGNMVKNEEEIPLFDEDLYGCAYSSVSGKAVFGMQYCGAVSSRDPRGWRILTKINNNEQHLLCANFDSTGRIVYGGSRDKLLKSDLRDPETTFGASYINTPSKVYAIQVMNNDVQLLASCDQGLLLMYDLRMEPHFLLRYEEHSNHQFKIPFNVDQQLRVLCSVGDDGSTRLWNLDTGRIINTIGYPPGIVFKQLPVAVFKSSWGKSLTMPSVIIGRGQMLYLYQM